MERRKKEMAFTSSIFLFVFFPICLLGFFLAHAVEKVGSVFKKLRLSDLFFVMARFDMQQQDWPEERWQAFAYKTKKK